MYGAAPYSVASVIPVSKSSVPSILKIHRKIPLLLSSFAVAGMAARANIAASRSPKRRGMRISKGFQRKSLQAPETLVQGAGGNEGEGSAAVLLDVPLARVWGECRSSQPPKIRAC